MKQISLCLTIMCLANASFAQKIKWQSGDDLAFLKDQKQIAVDYDYSKITVLGGPADQYLNKQKEELNKDEAGKGDEFVKEWTEARSTKYQVHFEKEFNKVLEKEGVVLSNASGAKYTIVVVANDMEMGKGKTFTSKPAKVDFTLMVVEADSKKVLSTGILEDVAGEVNAPKGSNWIPGGAGTAMAVTANVQNRSYSNRIAESYERAAGLLAKYIKKNVY